MSHNRPPCFVAIVVVAFVAVSLQLDSGFAYRLPDTGQTQCYNTVGNVIVCPSPGRPFYGQDGNYAGPQPAFQDNGDGTVTDLNTGLVWQQGDTHNNIGRTWQEAVDYCAGLDNLGGKSDWRLPSQSELVSIVNYARTSPSIDTTFFPDCRSYEYWSGTTVAFNPDYAWDVDFDDGYDVWNGKDTSYYVRCVRGGP